MGLEDSPKLDEAMAKAIETLGSSNRNKYRALFYTLLVQDLGLESKYDADQTEVKKETKNSLPESYWKTVIHIKRLAFCTYTGFL